jgi:CHAD domain-containing protein
VAFELVSTESVETGVRRIVDEQLQAALADLAVPDTAKADTAVHAARKRFKRIRAILRLVRDQLGEAVFALENAAFRDGGGSLAEARDAHVLVLTLDTLKESVDPVPFVPARKLLLNRRRAVKRRVLQEGNGLEGVANVVREARNRLETWAIPDDGWSALKSGLRRVYRDGRTAFEQADIGGHAELFHEWRKRTKDLWHQIELLEPLWPDVLKPLAEQFHCLADHLGNEHDLAVLKEVLEADALARAQGGSALLDAIESRRLDLQRQAKALGALLFAEKPGAFVRRLGKYWRAWKAEPIAEPQPEARVELTPVTETPAEAAAEPAPPVDPDPEPVAGSGAAG